ncbi:MAG: DNA cytosine methyltransferase [Deltaproteobacteria bacterium]|nr:DNA cytosine methyltransferase [Deltaproteobacteria bacterium]
MRAPVEVLELFSGIGAAGIALGERARVVAAFDQDPAANLAYVANQGRGPVARNLAGIKPEQLSAFASCAWWLSPPCQPYTVRGAGRDLDDPRSAALVRVLEAARALRPPMLALENVPGFAVSSARHLLRESLDGYGIAEAEICPTALGVPMRRRRYYLVACRDTRPSLPSPEPVPMRPLATYLDEPGGTYLPEAEVRGYGHSASILDASDPGAVANCFTSAYGNSPVRAGAYVRDAGGVRRFSPGEILRLLGFPAGWHFPPGLDLRKRYALAGNSLSIDAVRWVWAAALCP